MFTTPGPYGDNAPQGTESPSNPMFGMARSPHSSGGSNASNGTSAQMMQQLRRFSNFIVKIYEENILYRGDKQHHLKFSVSPS